jgi:hypothetical protein
MRLHAVYNESLGFEVVIAAFVLCAISWDLKVEIPRRLEGTYRFHLQG